MNSIFTGKTVLIVMFLIDLFYPGMQREVRTQASTGRLSHQTHSEDN